MQKKIAVVGASGFVGTHLLNRLAKENVQVRALGRSFKNLKATEKLETHKCDLFSLKEIENALQGQDVAIYLVHSMLPSSQLTQGDFKDYDLILADNFVRASLKAGVKHIIYLSGIIPQDKKPSELSDHLASRLEVENCLKASGIPVTTMRAGIILGEDGSSFNILFRLVQRLPMMICPKWTQSPSSPIYIEDVVESLVYSVSHPSTESQTFDLAGAETTSYLGMLQDTARYLHKKRFFIKFPLFTPGLSKLWVSLVTRAPKNLLYPLVESLHHNMGPQPEKTLRIPGWKYKSFLESMEICAPKILENRSQPKAFKHYVREESVNVVQSLQRMTLPKGWNAERVARYYVDFLQGFLRFIIRAEAIDDQVNFYLAFLPWPMLKLEYSRERSVPDRVLFYIVGGFLNQRGSKGRLEFRETFDKQFVLAAIHEYRPRLPWYIYKYTQAILHVWVMKSFSRRLLKIRDKELLKANK